MYGTTRKTLTEVYRYKGIEIVPDKGKYIYDIDNWYPIRVIVYHKDLEEKAKEFCSKYEEVTKQPTKIYLEY